MPTTPPTVQIVDLQKHFTRSDGQLVTAVDGISLDIKPGEFCVLLGPSGCGKTTLLRCIAGLEDPDVGSISLAGRPVFKDGRVLTAAREREIGMVFQSYALWPHMTVRDNVAFPLTTKTRRSRLRKQEITDRVRHALTVVGIPEVESSAISALSGGQQQRVALARAIVSGSEIILFDEPLSNVDAKVRIKLRQEIHALQRELGFAAIYVTHDQEEAMELADRLVVLNDGQIEQQGPPPQVYGEPVSRYVADFVGMANLVSGEVVRAGDTVAVDTTIGPIVVADRASGVAVGDRVTVALRPETANIVPIAADSDPIDEENTWIGLVVDTAFMGAQWQYWVEIGEQLLRVRTTDDALEVGTKVAVEIPGRRARLVTK